jgi:pimeloyl-ACP methyl ester carboxylesterase
VQTLRLRDGRALCVRRWPGGEDEALVLLHGMFDSSEGWSRLCERVGGLRVAFDLPGFGYSDPPSRASIAGYAEDVAEGLEMLGVRRFTLVGHSFGGAVAAALAELLPHQVKALVLLAPAGFGRIPLAEAVSVPGVRKLVEVTLPVLLANRLAVTGAYAIVVTNCKLPERDLVKRITSRRRSLAGGVRQGTRSLADARRSPAGFNRGRGRYPGPVQAVWGDRDLLVPASHSKGLRAAFPQARVDIWKGMGHHPTGERIDDLVEVVREAVAEGRGRSRPAALRLAKAA